MKTIRGDDYILHMLSGLNRELGEHLQGDVVFLRSPIRQGLDDFVRLEIERLHERNGKGSSKKLPKLIVVFETNGGYIEVVERLYNVFRQHYDLVDYVIPNYAYSAGTVLALSGDSIYMDYYSVLGPIDPQYETEDGKYVPGLGYLQKFKEMMKLINTNKGKPETYRAELAYLLKKFDPATLFHLEQARDHSISLLQTWLPRHKFKDWTVTETRRKRVTQKAKVERAKRIAEILSNPERWHSHGRGIGLQELTSEEIGLKIVNFGETPELNTKIRQYYDLLIDFGAQIGSYTTQAVLIHSQNGLRRA